MVFISILLTVLILILVRVSFGKKLCKKFGASHPDILIPKLFPASVAVLII